MPAEPHLRGVNLTSRTKELCQGLSRRTLDHLPAAVASRFAVAWAECIEGMMQGDEAWGFLASCKAKLILAPDPEDKDRNEEVKRRMKLWVEGRLEELAARIPS